MLLINQKVILVYDSNIFNISIEVKRVGSVTDRAASLMNLLVLTGRKPEH